MEPELDQLQAPCTYIYTALKSSGPTPSGFAYKIYKSHDLKNL